MLSCARVVALLAGIGPIAGAQTLVLDIDTSPVGPGFGSSNPVPRLVDGATTYVSASGGGAGVELWRTDGTGAGTTLVKNLSPGSGSGSPAEFVRLPNGTIVFAATDAAHGRELWRTDGTDAGTTLVADLRPGTASSGPFALTAFQGAVWFFANDGLHGNELWRTDGTAAGTTLVKDLIPGAASAGPSLGLGGAPVVVGATLYFAGFATTTSGWSLWRTDGSSAGTFEVAVLTSFVLDTVDELTAFQGQVYFTARHPALGEELWHSDGTGVGTQVIDVEPGAGDSSPGELTVVGAALFFTADGAATGRELWKTDGTAAGTTIVRDIGQGTGFFLGSQPKALTRIGTKLFFSATTSTSGPEPWISDGTFAGTTLLRDIRPGPTGSVPSLPTASGGRVFFSADDAVSGRELWSTDGTTAGTVLVADVNPGADAASPTDLFDAGGFLLFAANDGTTYRELWRSDGTAVGTQLVADLETSATQSSSPAILTPFADRLVFSASTPESGRELWTSDGSASGTLPVIDIIAGPVGSEPRDVTVLGDRFVFSANVPGIGRELLASDGTAAGTVLVKDINAGTFGSNPTNFAPYQDRLVFVADDGIAGRELWITDGTGPGTLLLADVVAGVESGSPSWMHASGDVLYLFGFDLVAGFEPMKLEGSNLTLLKDISPGSSGSTLGDPQFTEFGGVTYFAATDGPTGIELWRTDGTDAGTWLVKDVQPGFTGSSQPSSLMTFGGMLLFIADDGNNGRQVWRSDGTATGTQLVKVVGAPPIGQGVVDELMPTSEAVYFWGLDGATRALWKTDGTAAGTVVVVVVDPTGTFVMDGGEWARGGSGPHVVVQAGTTQVGREPWITDGTAAGTGLLEDVAPGVGGSTARDFVRSGSVLYFIADDGITGTELHALPIVQLGEYLAEPFGAGCPGGAGVPTLSVDGAVSVGSTFTLRLDGGVPGGSAYLFVGLGKGAAPLGSGCSLHVETPLVVAFAPTGPNGGWAIPIAPLPAHVGFAATMQAFPLDPQGTYLGSVSATSGLELLVGP